MRSPTELSQLVGVGQSPSHSTSKGPPPMNKADQHQRVSSGDRRARYARHRDPGRHRRQSHQQLAHPHRVNFNRGSPEFDGRSAVERLAGPQRDAKRVSRAPLPRTLASPPGLGERPTSQPAVASPVRVESLSLGSACPLLSVHGVRAAGRTWVEAKLPSLKRTRPNRQDCR